MCRKYLICFAQVNGFGCEFEPCPSTIPDHEKLEKTGEDGLWELPHVPFNVLDI